MFHLFKKKIGLALGAGSAKGLAHIGVIKELEKNNIDQGSSMLYDFFKEQ